jgi:hypothetical protein
MGIDRRSFGDHHDRFAAIVSQVHRVTALIAVTSFAGYALAGFALYRGHPWWALALASLSYALFRAFRPLSLAAARMRLQAREGFAETFSLLDRELCARPAKAVLAEIEGLIEATAQARQVRRSQGPH